MSIAEIRDSISSLSAKELAELEQVVHTARANRGDTEIYNDSYGVWTEDSQISCADFIAEAEKSE